MEKLKLKIQLSYDPDIPFFDTYLKDSKPTEILSHPYLLLTLLTTGRKQNDPRCLPTDY